MKNSYTSKLSAKFQISIPKAVRTEMQWQAGQEFVFVSKGEQMLLMPVPKIEDLCGILPDANTENYRERGIGLPSTPDITTKISREP